MRSRETARTLAGYSLRFSTMTTAGDPITCRSVSKRPRRMTSTWLQPASSALTRHTRRVVRSPCQPGLALTMCGSETRTFRGPTYSYAFPAYSRRDSSTSRYGADIVPWTEVEWRHMLRRAWLCWRCAHLPDLKDRMRLALTEDIAELDGWERLAAAVQPPTKEALLDPLFLDRIHTDRPRRILDYGAGKGRLAERLANDGFEVVAYDPVLPRVVPRPGLTITDARATALAGAPFDAVVCSLVLCVLEDEAYNHVLVVLRSALAVGGRIYIAICDPFFTCGGSTGLQRRVLPPDADPAETFVWHIRVGPRRETLGAAAGGRSMACSSPASWWAQC